MKLYGRSVTVNDGNVEKALRKFKKKIAASGVLQDLRDRETYKKPTTARKEKRNVNLGNGVSEHVEKALGRKIKHQ